MDRARSARAVISCRSHLQQGQPAAHDGRPAQPPCARRRGRKGDRSSPGSGDEPAGSPSAADRLPLRQPPCSRVAAGGSDLLPPPYGESAATRWTAVAHSRSCAPRIRYERKHLIATIHGTKRRGAETDLFLEIFRLNSLGGRTASHGADVILRFFCERAPALDTQWEQQWTFQTSESPACEWQSRWVASLIRLSA
jgi:hypothetical protein